MKRVILGTVLSTLAAASAFAQACICASGCVPLTPTGAPTVTATSTRTPPPTPTITPSPVASVRTVFLTESSAIFPNPEIGFETTQTVDSVTSNPRRIPTTQMEFGQFLDEGFANIDAKLLQAKAAGQSVLLKWAMCDPSYGRYLQGVLPGFLFRVGTTAQQFCADLDNPQVLTRVESDIAALGARYNGNPTVSHVNVGIAGLWGEWHYSGTSPQIPMPSQASSLRIINAVKNAFPSKHVIASIDGQWSRKAAAEDDRIGMRMDCWGGNANHEGSESWKLYKKYYADPAAVADVWRHAPVIGEPCGPLTSENTTQKVDLAISRHYSLINTKSLKDIPESQMPEWNRLLRKIGYRFVVRRYDVSAGTVFTIENVGIAPNYRPIQLSYAGETKLLEKIMPSQIVTRAFAANSGTLTAAMDVRPVQLANAEWSNGIEVR